MNNSFKSDTMGTRTTRIWRIYADVFAFGEKEMSTNGTNFHKL